MLVTHIYFNGQCKEAIDLYVKAFNATVKTVMQKPEQDGLIVHAEIFIHSQLLMLNDFGDNDGFSESGGYQLAVSFDNEEALKDAYSVLKDGSTIISPMQATDYSPCVVRFIDRFNVRWGFWVTYC
ncbi:MAG: VOC family protein [Clostridia bacterium]|nr:VOC family protein [Clostridia bacterium]